MGTAQINLVPSTTEYARKGSCIRMVVVLLAVTNAYIFFVKKKKKKINQMIKFQTS